MSTEVFRTESIDLAAFLVASGHELHIYRAPIQRAQKSLEIDAYKGGMKEGWLWMLPPKNAKKKTWRTSKVLALFGRMQGRYVQVKRHLQN